MAVTKKLQITGKGADGSRTFTIPNPISENDFDADLADTFVSGYDTIYGSDLTLTKAAYITTSETVVYPAA